MRLGVYFNYKEKGPGKVVSNLLKGLETHRVDYAINSDGDKNLILQNCERLRGDLSNCILGPNISTLPIDNHVVINHTNYNKFIVPSKWVKNLYSKWIPAEKICIWAAGIDTDLFSDKSNNEKTNDCLIYFKRRSSEELNIIKNFLKEKKQSFILVEYGKYNEAQFIEVITKSKYGIILDNTESQGIAIQEMMSCNLPLLVWDVKYWEDRGPEHKCEATSIPYWNNSCGEFFFDLNNIEEKFNLLINSSYNPRGFILEDLSIDKKTIDLIDIIS